MDTVSYQPWSFLALLIAISLALPAHAIAPSESETKSLEVPPTAPADHKNQSVGEEFKDFGEGVASRVDRIVKKNGFELWGDPWTIQGIPLVFPSANSGFNLGLRILLNNMRRIDPHKLEIETQVLSSDRGRYKYSLRFDQPHALDGRFRITARIAYDRDISFPYFGIGNETPIDLPAFENDSVLYRNVRAGPSFTFQILRHIGKYWRVGPIIGLKWTSITAPTGSLLDRDRPIGVNGGRTHHIGFAIVYDTLDFEPYPTRGFFHELFFSVYQPWTGSEYSFFRTTYTYRRYIRLHRELTFAHRTLLEVLSGDVPYYELGATGGSHPTLAMGGDRFFRGYQNNRFIDQIRLIMGFELRWDPIEFNFAQQEITLGLVPFVDMGRVWSQVFPLSLGKIHVSAGWGARAIWNSRFTLRSDFAFTEEGTNLYVEIGHSF